MNCYKDMLKIAANIASILTLIAAVVAWGIYQYGFYRKRKKLETHLRNEKEKAQDKGQRSLLHLMVKVGLTESEILQASFDSRHIKRLEKTDPETNLTEKILFEYVETDLN